MFKHPAVLVTAFVSTLAAVTVAPTLAAQYRSERNQAARKRMAGRISTQQRFLFGYLSKHPATGKSADARFRWMQGAESAYAKTLPSDAAPTGKDSGPRSRIAFFSPYVWSWIPMVVAKGSPSAALTDRTHVQCVVPSLLADLETVVDEREPGAPELLRIPDLGNGLAQGKRLSRLQRPVLERFRSAIERLPTVFAKWNETAKSEGVALPRHLGSASVQLRRFSKLIEVELGIREERLELAQARLSSLATPGDLPSGFESLVRRLAIGYRDASRTGAALAVLDMGLLATTEGSWPAAELRKLYGSCGGRFGEKRFELALARRAAPLVRSSIQFDPTTLVDIETGAPLDPVTLEGKPLVLDFMQRNCDPCLAAVPKLRKFQENHPEIAVVVVAIGTNEDRRAVLKDVRARGGDFPVLHDTANSADRLGVIGFPTYIVVSPDRIVLQPFGIRTEPTHQFEDVIGTLAPGERD